MARKPGRPRKTVDLQKLQDLAGMGCTHKEIAAALGICVDTLTDNFSEILNKGYLFGKIWLRRQQHKTAEAGNVTMQIWLGKNELGQTDKQEVTGADGGPIQLIGVWEDGVLAARRRRQGENDERRG